MIWGGESQKPETKGAAPVVRELKRVKPSKILPLLGKKCPGRGNRREKTVETVRREDLCYGKYGA